MATKTAQISVPLPIDACYDLILQRAGRLESWQTIEPNREQHTIRWKIQGARYNSPVIRATLIQLTSSETRVRIEANLQGALDDGSGILSQAAEQLIRAITAGADASAPPSAAPAARKADPPIPSRLREATPAARPQQQLPQRWEYDQLLVHEAQGGSWVFESQGRTYSEAELPAVIADLGQQGWEFVATLPSHLGQEPSAPAGPGYRSSYWLFFKRPARDMISAAAI